MATIDKKLIHFNRKAEFEARLAAGDIRDYSIVCIKDAKLIWTHGQYYGDLPGCLKVTEQQLSEEEKAQVMENLGLEIPAKVSELENDSNFVSAVDTGDVADDVEAGYVTEAELESALTDKQDKNVYFTNITASAWVSDSTYSDFDYRCDLSCQGVTPDDYAEVVFGVEQSTSGDYAPVCESRSNAVRIWSAKNSVIVVPTIIISK